MLTIYWAVSKLIIYFLFYQNFEKKISALYAETFQNPIETI
jgi:hypothetical protein